ncbi:hypothetical protein D0T08_10545 [Emticicia sp. C21]|nr:hypothetical protein D0T08_10545 [Emticicia sp. C21]
MVLAKENETKALLAKANWIIVFYYPHLKMGLFIKLPSVLAKMFIPQITFFGLLRPAKTHAMRLYANGF